MSAAVAQQVTNATEGVSLEVKKAPKVRRRAKTRRGGGGIFVGFHMDVYIGPRVGRLTD